MKRVVVHVEGQAITIRVSGSLSNKMRDAYLELRVIEERAAAIRAQLDKGYRAELDKAHGDPGVEPEQMDPDVMGNLMARLRDHVRAADIHLNGVLAQITEDQP